jgi:four helix bundle protein
MTEKADKISEDLLDLGLKIISISSKLSYTSEQRIIKDQMIRSGTSAGANYEEARGAESRADFIHKLHIVYKELRETIYWLRLLRGIDCKIDDKQLNSTIEKSENLMKIIAKSIITLKKKGPK